MGYSNCKYFLEDFLVVTKTLKGEDIYITGNLFVEPDLILTSGTADGTSKSRRIASL